MKTSKPKGKGGRMIFFHVRHVIVHVFFCQKDCYLQMANGQYKRTSHKNHAKSRFQLGILEVILGFISNSLRDKYIHCSISSRKGPDTIRSLSASQRAQRSSLIVCTGWPIKIKPDRNSNT